MCAPPDTDPGVGAGPAHRDTVNSLVLETLLVIRTLVENEQDPPPSLTKLHAVADHEEGWLQLVQVVSVLETTQFRQQLSLFALLCVGRL